MPNFLDTDLAPVAQDYANLVSEFSAIIQNKNHIDYNKTAAGLFTWLDEYTRRVRTVINSILGKYPSEIDKKIVGKADTLKKALVLCARSGVDMPVLAQRASQIDRLVTSKIYEIQSQATRFLNENAFDKIYIVQKLSDYNLAGIAGELGHLEQSIRINEQEIIKVLAKEGYLSHSGQHPQTYLRIIEQIYYELESLFNQLIDFLNAEHILILQLDSIIQFCQDNRVVWYRRWRGGNKNNLEYYAKVFGGFRKQINEYLRSDPRKDNLVKSAFQASMQGVQKSIADSVIEQKQISLGVIKGIIFSLKGKSYVGRSAFRDFLRRSRSSSHTSHRYGRHE